MGNKNKDSEILTFRHIFTFLIILLLVAILGRLFVFGNFEIPSVSMENTLQINNRVLVSKIGKVHRGDIIMFHDPGGWLTNQDKPTGWHAFMLKLGIATTANDDLEFLTKRVIGLPGDHIVCAAKCQHLTINGVAVDESSYIKEPLGPASELAIDVTVPQNMVYVLGDNRADSADSRYNQNAKFNGFVPINYIEGIAKVMYWPFSDFHLLKNPSAVFKNVPSPSRP